MRTHPNPNLTTLLPLRRGPLGFRHRKATESSPGKWLFTALLVLLVSAVVIGSSL